MDDKLFWQLTMKKDFSYYIDNDLQAYTQNTNI